MLIVTGLLLKIFLLDSCLVLLRNYSPPTIIQTISAEKELKIEIKVRGFPNTNHSLKPGHFEAPSAEKSYWFIRNANREAIPKIIERTTVTVIIIVICSNPSSLKKEYIFRKKRITKRMSWISAAFGRGRLGFFIFWGFTL